ncbi:hypothetical protein [Neobacillus vireti]|uniref:hypothetical protein n=1 Tax=Neobacillus vireti TaxID=220686 RepID=UPI002FFEC80E
MDININTLNSFLGYGDFRNADMLVWSKHEGANNDFLKQELDARIRHFGKNEEYWLDKTNRLNGYWHSSAEEAGEIKRSLMADAGLQQMDGGGVPFVVNYPSRILLALEEALEKKSNRNIDQWFNSLGTDRYSAKIQHTFGEIYEYNPSSNWKAALSHYQPLPRRNGTWPYADLFNHKDYANVFGLGELPENQAIAAIRDRREEIFADLLKRYPKKLIFCTGNYTGYQDSFYNFFKREFDLTLKPFRIGRQVKGLSGVFTYEGNKTVVINTQGFAFGGGLALDEVRLITRLIYSYLKD